jgi:5,10-methenyltetrahydrofolate synthetase
LRRRLLVERALFAASPESVAAGENLGSALRRVIAELEPACLGLYCPLRSEFNAARSLLADAGLVDVSLALPYARREGCVMEYRRWNGEPPTVTDECGIGSSEGAAVVPDVVVVPCVGFTADGHRLGYGGGYYDRWLALHPQVTSVGVGWSFAEIGADAFATGAHDVALAIIVTERGVR